MFNNLTESLSQALKKMRGCGRLTEDNLKDTLREVRKSLLEADVSLPVVRSCIRNVKERAINQIVNKSLTPSQEFIKLMKDELTLVMGEKNETLNLKIEPPAVILLVGQQGSGKTTSVAKISKLLHDKYKKKVLMVSTDIYRPAAIQQLETLSKEIGLDFFSSYLNQNPIDIVKSALHQAKLRFHDVLIVDTSGCLYLDSFKMKELKELSKVIKPIETLLVVDAMTGQDAANIARAFNESLQLTGIILTKLDGDARGGAALSIRYVTGKPIKFMGVGEKLEALEPFHPDRIASRILGMGDILSLIEDIENKVDRVEAEKLAQKTFKNNNLDFNDFLNQLKQFRNIGGVSNLLNKLPGMKEVPDHIQSQLNNTSLKRMEAMIQSMTRKERQCPHIIKGSRKRRIAFGSGVTVQDVNRLLKQLNDMQQMVQKIKKGGMEKMMRNIKDMIPTSFTRH
ncbi:Signal recognition particle protein [Candidatus Erwinia haradaeae]|uniref:Signal recognition particle protein n=1 Tax=Candidatus Erwinia haradaeae TaxID=1922217 RepID=A0A451D046_9GAMM|nr:signal recognition particle protein [Candidatus Erwinia haradaeae]VFP78999.1 Signal recognition particle protein [Candidatus Erwinia haradaeae]